MSIEHAASRLFTAEQVAVALCRGNFGFHVGVAFTDRQNARKLLHLRWHKLLAVDDYPIPTVDSKMPGCWIASIPDIPATSAKAFVGILRKVARRRPEIQYGVNLLAGIGSFDPKGNYTRPADSDGLTCATFISELF